MINKKDVLLSPVNLVGDRLRGYNFYEESLGFGSVQEVNKRSDGCIDAEITLDDQDGQMIVEPSVPLFGLRPGRIRKLIAYAANENPEEGSVSLR